MFLRMSQPFRAVIRKWGNSPALRLNAAVMQQADFTLEQPVQLKVTRGRIVIEPSQSTEFRLEDLVAAITPASRHKEITAGAPVGNEAL